MLREIMIFLITAGAWDYYDYYDPMIITAGAWELLSGGCLQSWHCLCLGKGQHLVPKNALHAKKKQFDNKKII